MHSALHSPWSEQFTLSRQTFTSRKDNAWSQGRYKSELASNWVQLGGSLLLHKYFLFYIVKSKRETQSK